MPNELAILIAASLVAVCAMRVLAKPYGPASVTVISAATLLLVSWQSALWLFAGMVVTLGSMSMGERHGVRTQVFVGAVVLHATLLVLMRDLPGYAWIGCAYFTLRHIHVLSDWWIGALPKPKLGEYARYHLFLPVLAAGPIHRFEPFQRQMARRRNDLDDLLRGSERLLWGAFQCVVLGHYGMTKVTNASVAALNGLPYFFNEWVRSACGWIGLYLMFAGLSSIAIGLALMMGLRIEENFNAPWRAKNLVEF